MATAAIGRSIKVSTAPMEIPFAQLIEQVNACQLCHQQLPLGAKPILQANTRSKILIAGQAPGRITHQKGRPFDDPSGQRLRTWLGVNDKSFYDPDKFAILPMGFCFPGSYDNESNKRGDKPPLAICASQWREALLKQLESIELTLILGKYATAYHLGKQIPLTQAVKSWQEYWPNQLVLPHPSPRNNIWLKRNPYFEAEIVPMLQARVAQILNAT